MLGGLSAVLCCASDFFLPFISLTDRKTEPNQDSQAVLFLDRVTWGACLRVSSEDSLILEPRPWNSFEDCRRTQVSNPGGRRVLVGPVGSTTRRPSVQVPVSVSVTQSLTPLGRDAYLRASQKQEPGPCIGIPGLQQGRSQKS